MMATAVVVAAQEAPCTRRRLLGGVSAIPSRLPRGAAAVKYARECRYPGDRLLGPAAVMAPTRSGSRLGRLARDPYGDWWCCKFSPLRLGTSRPHRSVPPQGLRRIVQTELDRWRISMAPYRGEGARFSWARSADHPVFFGRGQVVIERRAARRLHRGREHAVRDRGPVASNQMGGNIRVDKAAGEVRAHSAQSMIESGRPAGGSDTQGFIRSARRVEFRRNRWPEGASRTMGP
jgi:hypothetical protein